MPRFSLFMCCSGRWMLCVLGVMCIAQLACVGYLMQVMHVYVCSCHLNLATLAYSYLVSHANTTEP